YPAGLFGIVTGAYDFPIAFTELDAYFTNKAPGGIAYRCSFRVTEAVGAGPSKHFDIMGIKMFDSAEIRVHPTGSAILRAGTKSQGQGHETTWAQIAAEELGLDPQNIIVEEGDTDTAPYGLGTYASRSTPVAGAAIAMAARRIREKARAIAAHLLEAPVDDVEWSNHAFQVAGNPENAVTMQEVAFAAYTNPGPGNEPGLEASFYYDPPNLTFPYGAYLAVVDVDRETGAVNVRRFLAIDDCGTVINPMIVEGQIHGGLAQGIGQALLEHCAYDGGGQLVSGSFMDYAVARADDLPPFVTECDESQPCTHNPLGAKGCGEAGSIGAPAAVVSAVLDALAPLGVTDLDMPLTSEQLWRGIRNARSKAGSSSSEARTY
ncbi:MAG: molybdopterin-dependent oxidoreductase, partial [Hyphomicrobiales bacterium]|nr:molybdopterin-dependent oxidoreductase [Hyphomicrobiales bacterium]